jgi:predicted 2-oxoglutarate/Fe(II)-dependent dioxygenase YbiX
MAEPKLDFITVNARAPMFYGMCHDRSFFTLKQQQGRPAVLILAGARAGAAAARIADGIAARRDAFAAHDTDILLLVSDAPGRVLGDALAAGPVRAIDCGSFIGQCGVGPGDTLVLLLDRHLRVVARFADAESADIARLCLEHVAALPAADPVVLPTADAPADPFALMDRAPACCGPSSDGRSFSLAEQYGRPSVLLLAGAEAMAALPATLAAFAPYLPRFAARNADMYVVVEGDPAAVAPHSGVRAVGCGGFLADCGVRAGDLVVLVLDRSLRIALRSRATVDPAIPQACLACLEALPFEAPRDATMPAPVIVLPNLLPQGYCRDLIALFESGPAAEGTVAHVDETGQARNVVDHARKHRRDMLIESGTRLHRHLQELLVSRCQPEIARAFQAKIAYTDRILLARYDASGGWFRRHRDNDGESVAFRQFALSVNLNTGEYDGGHLLFAEYSDHRHAPPAGGGLVFSTSLLHEAAPVTRGTRYVLLTFFHDEAAEARRRALAGQSASGRLVAAG